MARVCELSRETSSVMLYVDTVEYVRPSRSFCTSWKRVDTAPEVITRA
jgi:hypothetical protein